MRVNCINFKKFFSANIIDSDQPVQPDKTTISVVVVVVVLLLNVHGQQLRSCWDGQLT